MCLPVKPFAVEKEWTHAGLSCAVVMNQEHAHRCGYVRVPSTHPLHGKDYNDVDVNVHGGLTFGDIEPCSEHEDGVGYWFGFDCAHGGDANYEPGFEPSYLRMSFLYANTSQREHWWTLDEVVKETNQLAEQLAEVTNR